MRFDDMHKVLDAKFIAPVKSTETSENNISSVLLSDFVCDALHVKRIVVAVHSMEMGYLYLYSNEAKQIRNLKPSIFDDFQYS